MTYPLLMPKPTKSSASSATRKKHAKKAAGATSTEDQPQFQQPPKPTKKQIKKGLAPPPKKQFIPPSKLKPAPTETDPLDAIAHLLSADVVLILRKMGKKDAVTKGRALEELETWLGGVDDEEEVVSVVPVWVGSIEFYYVISLF